MCRRSTAPIGLPIQQPTLQVQVPSLTRKLVGSAKINLNKYWSVLEAMVDPQSTNIENENLDNERRLAKMNLGRPSKLNCGLSNDSVSNTTSQTDKSSS